MENKTFNKLISSIVSIIFTIIVFSTVTFAWLYSNRNVNSSGDKMSLYFDDTCATYSVYRYDVNEGCGTDKDASGNNLDIKNIDFNQYDLIFEKRNRYTPIFARIVIKRIEKMPLTGIVTLKLERIITDDNLSSLTRVNEYATSVMKFTGFVSKTTNSITDADEMYKKVDNELYNYIVKNETNVDIDENKLDSNVFLTKNDSTYTKTDYITLSMQYDEDDWDDDTLSVYLYMSYDDSLIEYYRESNELGTSKIGDDLIDFKNDLNVLRVSYESSSN